MTKVNEQRTAARLPKGYKSLVWDGVRVDPELPVVYRFDHEERWTAQLRGRIMKAIGVVQDLTCLTFVPGPVPRSSCATRITFTLESVEPEPDGGSWSTGVSVVGREYNGGFWLIGGRVMVNDELNDAAGRHFEPQAVTMIIRSLGNVLGLDSSLEESLVSPNCWTYEPTFADRVAFRYLASGPSGRIR